MGCRPVSSRLITIHLRAAPFNITIVQGHAPTSVNDDNETEELYDPPHNIIDRHQRRTFFLYKETGMQNWARMLVETGKAFVDPSATMTQMREDSGFWSLPPSTILRWRTLLVITKHPEDGPSIAQMDNTTIIFIHSSEEALPIRSEHCQNTKFSVSRHWK